MVFLVKYIGDVTQTDEDDRNVAASAQRICHFRWDAPLHLPMNAIVSIDDAGRLVLPKRFRVQFNLHAGSELEVAACPDHLELRPVRATTPLKEVGSLLVHRGSTRAPLTNAVRQLRGERATAQSRGIGSYRLKR